MCLLLTIVIVAGVLKPKAATLLIGAIRAKYPELPIHVHTHDSAGTGVASMVACAQAGADAVDAATDSMSGMTSQPSIGALTASLEGSEFESGLNSQHLRAIDSYWAQVRLVYSPFEAGLTGPDPEVYEHEIPGGQLTNLIFQVSLNFNMRKRKMHTNYLKGFTTRSRQAMGADQEGLRAGERSPWRYRQGHPHLQGGW